jgi:hypothetical protein
VIEVEGLDEFAKAMRRVDPRIGKALQKAHKEISKKVSAKVESAVGGLGTPRSGDAARGVRPRAGQREAVVALLGSNKFIRSAVMGTQVHWVFGRPVRADSMLRRVWQPWVGNDWTAEDGLYGVSPAISAAIPTVVETYADAIDQALSEAFPD